MATAVAKAVATTAAESDTIIYKDYEDESSFPQIQALVSKDLSEPYSVFTYRYFLQVCPNLCICAYAVSTDSTTGNSDERMIGCIVSRADSERLGRMTGYIAMLTVDDRYRKRGIGIKLAQEGIARMINMGCEEITLEAEATNAKALALYEKLGFMRDEMLPRYYLNGNDAYRLKLFIPVYGDEIGDCIGSNDVAVKV